MSPEAKVNALDYAFHENNKILEATHGVDSLILNEQREKFKEVDAFIAEQKAFNKAIDRRFDKDEEFLIQIVNHLAQLTCHLTTRLMGAAMLPVSFAVRL
ncbi:hypothetical protein [Endozoicomonas sp. ISHI1]|uniref:hypothetical protein n=1 Tax=Endozoicomonas sp. ISHI1 TaxID=2825882 RepID=UPI00214935A6|nr:hypothetical protein [Endozoicomonas sp. ISHI1]